MTRVPISAHSVRTINALRQVLERVECRLLAISGGEPLLHPDLYLMLEALQSYRIPTVLTTNGMLLSARRATELMSRGISSFQVSLHSHLEERHNWLSGGIDSWANAVSAIVSARSCGAQVVPVFVATKENLNDFENVIELCASLAVTQIVFNRVVPPVGYSRSGHQFIVPSDEEIRVVLRAADERARGRNIFIQLGVPVARPVHSGPLWTNIRNASCPVGRGQSKWTIGVDLAVRRCNQGLESVGLLDEKGLTTILDEARSNPHSCGSASGRPCLRMRAVRLR